MSDNFEDLLKRWLRDRAGTDRSALQALAGNVAALPPRRQPRRLLPLVASIAVLFVVLTLAAPRFAGVGTEATLEPSPTVETSHGPVLAGGPEAFADDPRLETCGGQSAEAEFVFEMTHGRDYQRYLPAMLRSPELEIDAAVLVVVFREGFVPQTVGLGGPAPSPSAPQYRTLCVVIRAEPTYYGNVNITGLTIDVVPSSPQPTPSQDEPSAAASTTPGPAPAWASNLGGQLDCDGPLANIGSDIPDVFGWPDSTAETPEQAVMAFLGPGNPFSNLPTAGFESLHAEPHWATFGHVVDGRLKAILLLADASEMGPGWTVVALRACDASEFDPTVPLTFPVTIWIDASGQRVSTETIRSNPGPGHCGWESTIWLHVNGELYVRDPAGVMAEWTTTAFEAEAAVPPTATETGYRSGDLGLWLDPDGDAYLVTPAGVERWPRSIDPFLGCA